MTAAAKPSVFLCVGLFVCVLLPPAAACMTDYTEEGFTLVSTKDPQHCYYVGVERTTILNAHAQCDQLNGHVVWPETMSEQDFLMGTLRALGGPLDVWLGVELFPRGWNWMDGLSTAGPAVRNARFSSDYVALQNGGGAYAFLGKGGGWIQTTSLEPPHLPVCEVGASDQFENTLGPPPPPPPPQPQPTTTATTTTSTTTTTSPSTSSVKTAAQDLQNCSTTPTTFTCDVVDLQRGRYVRVHEEVDDSFFLLHALEGRSKIACGITCQKRHDCQMFVVDDVTKSCVLYGKMATPGGGQKNVCSSPDAACKVYVKIC